jgi:hypothetical protein
MDSSGRYFPYFFAITIFVMPVINKSEDKPKTIAQKRNSNGASGCFSMVTIAKYQENNNSDAPIGICKW